MDRLFFTSAVFIVRTDSRVSFSLLRICTSFLWLLSSLEMFFICCWLREKLPRESEAFPWGRQDWSWSSVPFRCSWSFLLFDLPSKKFNKKYKHSHQMKSWNYLFDIYLTTPKNVVRNCSQEGRPSHRPQLPSLHRRCPEVPPPSSSAFPLASVKRNRITFKLKTYKDGKVLKAQSNNHNYARYLNTGRGIPGEGRCKMIYI